MDIIRSLADRVPQDAETVVGADGLLHCSRCGGARQARISLLDVERIVPCVCPCLEKKRTDEDEQQRRMEWALQLEQMRTEGFPERETRGFTFEADDGALPQITEAMRRYCDGFLEFKKDGKGLLLYGSVGTGKTFYAGCVVNELIERGYPCLLTSVTRIVTQLSGKAEGKQDFLDGLTRYSLVALDDLGVERDTEFVNETLSVVVDALYRGKIPMIITCNLSPAQIAKDEDGRRQRTFDRILERCHPIKIDGISRRKQTGRDSYAEMKKLLGV